MGGCFVLFDAFVLRQKSFGQERQSRNALKTLAMTRLFRPNCLIRLIRRIVVKNAFYVSSMDSCSVCSVTGSV